MINKETIQALRDAIEKCGGRGGTPGPCAGPRQPKKPPKPLAAKPQNRNRVFTEREQRLWDEAKKKPPKKKPPKKKPIEEAVMPHFDEILKSRKKVHQLALKLGFKPTSKDPDVAVQQAVEWAQVRAATKALRGKTSKNDINPRILLEAADGAPKVPKKPKQPVTEPGKKKPPKDPIPPKKPGRRPITDPKTGKTSVGKKPGTVDDITNEAKSVLELTKSPETRRVDVAHPTIARLAGRSFSKVVQALAGMKPSEIWPNRRQAAKNLAEKFKKEFTDENAETLIQTAVSHVRKVFTKEGAAARIMSHFLKEQPW